MFGGRKKQNLSSKKDIENAFLLTKRWTHANEAKPPPRSPLQYGWRNENKYLMPKYFEGPMTFDFLQDLVCMCKGKFICSKNCVCGA
jgi:hypothetical protein